MIDYDKRCLNILCTFNIDYNCSERLDGDGCTVYQPYTVCRRCLHFNFMRAFNYFDCSIQRNRSGGINDTCNDWRDKVDN